MAKNEITKQGEEIVKSKRQSPNGNGSPTFGENGLTFKDDDEKKAYIQKTLTDCFEIYVMPKVNTDEELVERLDWYFRRCAERGIKPNIEEMCMATGYVRATVWDWETGRRQGFTSATADIVKKAKEFMANFDAKMVNDGKLNPVTYIFRSKNYYGMKDQQEYVLTPNAPLGSENPDAAVKLLGDLPE